MMAAVVALIPSSGLTTAVCTALEVSRASVHRHRRALTHPPRAKKPRSPVARALPDSERDQVLAHLSTPRFADQTPTEVYATLLDEGVYRPDDAQPDPLRTGRCNPRSPPNRARRSVPALRGPARPVLAGTGRDSARMAGTVSDRRGYCAQDGGASARTWHTARQAASAAARLRV